MTALPVQGTEQYVRDAENAGMDEAASFFKQVMDEDAARAKKCHDLISQLAGSDASGPSVS